MCHVGEAQIHFASGREGSKSTKEQKKPPKTKNPNRETQPWLSQPHLQFQTPLKNSSQLITAFTSWLSWKWKLLQLFTDTLIHVDYEGV